MKKKTHNQRKLKISNWKQKNLISHPLPHQPPPLTADKLLCEERKNWERERERERERKRCGKRERGEEKNKRLGERGDVDSDRERRRGISKGEKREKWQRDLRSRNANIVRTEIASDHGSWRSDTNEKREKRKKAVARERIESGGERRQKFQLTIKGRPKS